MIKSVSYKNLDIHSSRSLFPRVLVIAIFIFLFFTFFSYIILNQYKQKALNSYFQQIYNSNTTMVEKFLKDELLTLQTLAYQPLYNELIKKNMEYYNNTELTPAEKRKLIYENNNKQQSTHSFYPLQFVTTSGLILYGLDIHKTLTPFPNFNLLLNNQYQNKKSGFFTVVSTDSTPKKQVNILYPTIVFYQTIPAEGSNIPGYFVCELELEMLTGRPPIQRTMPEQKLTSPQNPPPLFLENQELYLIDKNGIPISPLRLEEDYVETLKSLGYEQPLIDIPINDFFSKNYISTTKGQSNIPLISKMLSDKQNLNNNLITFKQSYKNYMHRNVYGAGFWIPSLDIGIVIERDASSVNSPYITIWSFIFFVIFLLIGVLLYLILWIDKLRILSLDANPLTHLPGNRSINAKIQSAIDKKEPVAVVYGDLDNFKAYNDNYGFAMGDKVIQFTADILKKATKSETSKSSFCGHIGGDDFIFMVPESDVQYFADKIECLFESGIKEFYNKEDLSRGYIVETNRNGETIKYPLMAFSMAGIRISQCKITHFLEVANICGEVKKISKKTKGTKLILDRRHEIKI